MADVAALIAAQEGPAAVRGRYKRRAAWKGNVMSLSDLASIGSLVSGVAVLVSLVYLSLQVRQAEKNQRALMNQGAITRVTDILVGMTQPAINAARTRMEEGATNFTAEEIVQLQMVMRATLLNLQDVWVQHRNGLIDQITFDNSIGFWRSALAQPVNRALWMHSRPTYASEMAIFVDKLIEQSPLAKPVDLVAQLKSDLVEVLR